MAADFPQQPKSALWAMQKLATQQAGRICTAPLVDTVRMLDDDAADIIQFHCISGPL